MHDFFFLDFCYAGIFFLVIAQPPPPSKIKWSIPNSIFELFIRRTSLLYFFPSAFNIKLVKSFILVWHSDYELFTKTQKPFFSLKESSKCHHDINYRAKNHVVLFLFGFQSIARFINTNAPYFNTRRLESEGKFFFCPRIEVKNDDTTGQTSAVRRP